MVWSGAGWGLDGMVWCGVVWCGVVWFGAGWDGVVCVWYVVVYDMIWPYGFAVSVKSNTVTL